MHRIGVISDTHGLLRPEVKELLRECDAILHAGDIDRESVVSQLKELAPLYVVRGNADKEWAEHLPVELTAELFGYRFYLVHNKKHISDRAKNADFVIYGHSHKYEEKRTEGQMHLNPGSCGKRRFTQPITMALIEIDEDGGAYRIVRKDLAGEAPVALNLSGTGESVREGGVAAGAHEGGVAAGAREGNAAEGETQAQDLALVIRSVVKGFDKGRSVGEIAKKCGISEELAEQICRMYATHPGIDTDGIINRIIK